MQKREKRGQGTKEPRGLVEDTGQLRNQRPEFGIAGGTAGHLNGAVLNLGGLGELGGCPVCEQPVSGFGACGLDGRGR